MDYLIDCKAEDFEFYSQKSDEEYIRKREEISLQIDALNELKAMAQKYGFDISKPATCLAEAVQWTYFAYLAAIKAQDGAAMSFGRPDAFLDIFAERDLAAGRLDESGVQVCHLSWRMSCTTNTRPSPPHCSVNWV